MPRLAAFPKAYLDALCVDGTMTIREWIDLAATLDIEGLEFYTGFRELQNPAAWPKARQMAADRGLTIPMLCASPDFTHPDPKFRAEQIETQKRCIDMCEALGGKYCRVLSGQRRPEVSRTDGICYAAEAITDCLPRAIERGVTLVLENHYKDNYWTYPEFAQRIDIFLELIDRIDSPYFGVNYDPSNAILAGDDPLAVLRSVKHRVVTMHASDRYLVEGTLDDIRLEEANVGYVSQLRHGVIGRGLNDYDAIFSILAGAGFTGWISIEDGVDGIEQLRESAAFLRRKVALHWPAVQQIS